MKVLVFGCGPAGLMAAHAFAMEGHDVIILSRKRKSEMYGAQYLHAPIPGMTPGAGFKVDYTLTGTVEQYRDKVYGKNRKVEVSPASLVGVHDGWDIRGTYHELWMTYGEYVQNYDVDEPNAFSKALADYAPDHVVSTIPRPVVCADERHSFQAQMAWAIGDAPERGVFCPVKAPKNSVRCNGEASPGWYRSATILGYSTAEWPWENGRKPPLQGVSEVTKPLWHDCTCFPDVQYLGRYGVWNKGVLSHEAFFQAQATATGVGIQTGLWS